jgi:hypothetical protein
MSKKNKSPSRLKYEAENPTVSGRVPKRTRASLYKNLANLGMSLADGLKVLAGELEVKVKPINEAWQDGFDAGEESGINRAEELYAMRYKCSGCGEEMFVTTDEEKAAIRRFIKEQRWGHRKCLEQRG